MNAAIRLVNELASQGAQFVPKDGNGLSIKSIPNRLLTPDRLEALKRHKAEIIALIQQSRQAGQQKTVKQELSELFAAACSELNPVWDSSKIDTLQLRTLVDEVEAAINNGDRTLYDRAERAFVQWALKQCGGRPRGI